MYWIPYSSNTSPHSSKIPCLLMPLKNWCSIHARCFKSRQKHSIRFCGIFSKFKKNFIAYRSSKVSSRPDCIFENHQLWQSGFSRVYSNFCCSCSFEPEILKIGQSSHKVYSNNILNFQESTTIFHACTKKVWKCIEGTTYTLPKRPKVESAFQCFRMLRVSVRRILQSW